MLIYKDKQIKVYATNNLLLVLNGETIIKELYVEDKCLIDDIVTEYKEKQFIFKKSFAVN